jgi:hypothetical protein|tara:strand:- start:245 stop:391 length:147 start_codon:yes stop_codon:yes gene_type:complete
MELTQREIEQLSPEEYSCLLAYGDAYICKTTTDEDYEEYLRSHLEFDL